MSARRPPKGGRPPRGTPPPMPPPPGTQPPPRIENPGRGRRARTGAATKDAHMAIGKVHRGLRSLRGLLVVDAVTLGIIFALSQLGNPPSVVSVFLGTLFVGAVLGAVLVVDNPYPWCIMLALGHSGLAALMMLSPGLTAYIAVGIALLLWWAVGQAATARRMKREYPDAWAEGSRTYTGLDSAAIGSKFRDRAKADQKKRTQRLLLIIGVPLGLLVGAVLLFSGPSDGGGGSSYTPKPPAKPTKPLDARAKAFEDAWNTSTRASVVALIAPSEKTTLERLLRKVIRRRKWADAYPAAAPGELTKYDATHYYAHHDLEGYGFVTVSWVWEHDDWWIVRFKFKQG